MTTHKPGPFADLHQELERLGDVTGSNNISHKHTPSVRLDPSRQQRTGIPEIIHAEHKPPEEVVRSLASLAEANGRAIASRCTEETLSEVRARLVTSYDIAIDERARIAVVARRDSQPPVSGGRVGVLSAGSSDAPVAAEATLMAREMGCEVWEAADVGVAGLHRLVEPLSRMTAADVDVLVVAAGMDGALPSVVAGLVSVPVIGLPTSVGYGAGGQGRAALLTMLQSCAPGLVVVNIDNGIGAGSTAALIANQVAAARSLSATDINPR